MKFGRNLITAAAAVVFLLVEARADLSSWVQREPAGSMLDVLLRSLPMPGGPVRFRRPPAETRPALTQLIGAHPNNPALRRLRAQEAEMQVDFTVAENDWKAYADLATDRGEGYLQLADFYERRVKAPEEVAALAKVGTLPVDRFVPPSSQSAWMAFNRMVSVIHDAGLPAASASAAYRSWIARYPKEQTPRQYWIAFLINAKQYASAEAQIAAYTRAFPEDISYPVQARADLATQRSSTEAALVVYDQAYQPLWPAPLLTTYFQLLDKNGELRDFLARARTAREKNPADIESASRLFAYYQYTNNAGAARRALFEYRLAKEAASGTWTPRELRILARLFERLPDVNEQARAYYALYSIPAATADDRETALAGMVSLLLEKPFEPVRFGSGDLSLYKDIGAADSSPGFLNGLLSLVLNSTSPAYQYRQENSAAGSYFHRAEGAKLLELLEQRFPASSHRAPLRASLIAAYASYGDDDAVITTARAFLTAFPKAAERTHVALTEADALARKQQINEELAVYQQMLRELSARADGVPLGANAGPAGQAFRRPGFLSQFRFGFAPVEEKPASTARSPDYAEVLDKYLARLSALHRPMDALRLYRRELDRNPNDPGLYERFAAFLEQNNPGAGVQEVYRRAIAKFQDKSWYDKLARWYLRGKQESAFQEITREATWIFSGTDLETYFRQIVQTANLGAELDLQLNLYAHQRFPEDLVFVNNLINRYQSTGDNDAAKALLRDYWFYDANLKRRYFEQLSSQGDLVKQMASIEHDHPEIQAGQWQPLASANPAALQFHAEAEAWLSHFEAAAPGLRKMAELYPGSLEKDVVASSIYRSLAAYFPNDTSVSAAFARKAAETDPRDTKLLETVGDIYADREEFAKAAMPWKTIPRVFPGKPDGYIEAATVYWDYYRFNDALNLIREARVKFHDQAMFAYEAGAIYEGRHDYRRAVDEYLSGWQDGSQPARARIVRLSARPALRDLIYQMTDHADPALRVAVLKAQQRQSELAPFLAKEIAGGARISEVSPLIDVAREQNLPVIERQGLEREIAVSQDPVERMRLSIEFARYLEGHKEIEAAAATINGLYRDHPAVLGVVRAKVDFDTRNQRETDAVATLTDAASKANPELSASFRFEASRIATKAGQIEEARALLSALLKTDPYRPAYLAQMADTYAAAHDDAGFMKFADDEIDSLKNSPLPPEDRKAQIAAVRPSLIATLARRGNNDQAIDQYIETINAYPADEQLTREASLFASAHGQTGRLISFYQKTVAASPRDWRWPIVLARIDTTVEDYPAALKAYDAAMKARPDRADLVQARAELEERILHFEDAANTYTRLYDLTYHDPQWLDKAAEMQARLGRNADAIATLDKAHLGPGGETVTGLFAVAALLDEWHLTQDAARYADRGIALPGADMEGRFAAQYNTYARIMAGVRRTDAILALHSPEARRAAGLRIAELWTPEEKAALAGKPGIKRELAEAAGLEDVLANVLSGEGQRPRFMALQSRRGLYEELSRYLLNLANHAARNEGASLFAQAATAASRAGDITAEIAIYSRMQSLGMLGGRELNRYLALLLARDPKTLVAQRSNQAIQVAIAADNRNAAMDALRARAAALPPVWLSSYSALTGVYFDERSPAIDQAFLTVLRPLTVAQRLASKPDPALSLIGSVWFYYGARFGERLQREGSATAADYLPSDAEARPANPEAYLALGWFYAANAVHPKAIAEFRKALDLDRDRGEAHDGIARSRATQGQLAEAIAEWRESIAAFEREQSKGVRVRETFWSNVSAAINAISLANAFAELQPNIHHLLVGYLNINDSYRFNELLEPALDASYRAKTGFEWVLDIAPGPLYRNSSSDPDQQEWFAKFDLALALRKAPSQNGPKAEAERLALINILLRHGKVAEALTQWRQFTSEDLETFRRERNWTEIQIAGAEGTLDQRLTAYRADPINAPNLQEILQYSGILRQDKKVLAALSLLEFGYTREIEAQHLDDSNFLGWARVYLERGNQLPQALALLRRMTLVATVPNADSRFAPFESAGDLLVESHHDQEAREFYASAVRATPWNVEAKLKLGRAAEVVSDTTAPYRLRAEAARRIAPSKPAVSGELALLASGTVSPDAARRPYNVESRITAAAQSSLATLKLSLLGEALAIAPENPKVRLAAVHAALDARKDQLALSLYQQAAGRPLNLESPPDENAIEAGSMRIDPNRELLEALSAAAERIGDLGTAVSYAEMTDQRRVEKLKTEQKRQVENRKRQPVITDKPEQTQIVRPRELP